VIVAAPGIGSCNNKDELVKMKAPSAKPLKPAAKATSQPTTKGKPKPPSSKSKPSAKAVPVKVVPTVRPKPVVKQSAAVVPTRSAAKTTPVKPAASPGKPAIQGKSTAKVPTLAAKPALKPIRKTDSAKPAKPNSNLRVEAAIPSDKDLSAKNKNGAPVKDRVHLTAPDAYWLHVFWELSMQSVQRAEAALNQDWHGSKAIIRLFDVTSTDTTSTSEAALRDIVVHGGCSHWYIDIPQPPRSYRADIGYLTRTNRFYPLARSNVMMPPKAGASEVVDGELSKEAQEEAAGHGRDVNGEHFRRPLKEPAFGSGAVLPGKLKKFFFDLDAELIVYVKTDPTATVTLQNEPIKIRPDGTATMRYSLPDSRQIIPAVACSADGMEEQTIVLAVERNTKRLDPMLHDLYNDT